MRISLLGPVSIHADGIDHPMASKQLKQALAILALSAGRTIVSETLADELWPETELKNVRNALHATIRRLRRALDAVNGAGVKLVIETVPAGYRLNICPDRVDALRFRSLSGTARQRLGADPAGALIDIDAALALWRDGALHDLPGVGRIGAEQRQLNEARAEVLEMRAEAQIVLEEFRGAAAELRLLAAIYPDRERLHELLMYVLYEGGQQSEALLVFRNLQARMRDEFGLTPGLRIRRLHDAILSQNVGRLLLA